jgi:hypothetical protein
MDDHDLWMAFFNDPDGHTLDISTTLPLATVCRHHPKFC